ncbi:uncharacterized protein LOC124420665 [Lucilia cuprina]|uniref:uncharacterized protein LOC124420665 n=1 Tax=Lucilia cuprina TaxID=7375 RepID=UPI001F05FEB1|nr:uncharacterized protein LOC124420665 [Lucilia cuprina]
MYNLIRLIILLFCTAVSSGQLNSKLLTTSKLQENVHFYTELLMEIKSQKNFDSILMVHEKLQNEVLEACEKYKITNGILHFLNSSILEEVSEEYLQLLPYPQYHLKTRHFGRINEDYFPIHWRDMKGKTLMTLPDQLVPRSIMYRDRKGQIKPEIGKIIHYSFILNMTKRGELDMPMSVNPIFTARSLRHMSYPTEVSKWMIMIPCSTRMTICDVYELMLTPQLFGVIIIFTVTFSVVHTIIEKLFYKQMIWLNLVMCDKVIPGVLGQSFNVKKSSVLSLQIEADDDIFNNEMKGTIVYTDNSTLFGEVRDSFNSTYGYTVTLTLWNIYSHVQMYYAQKKFCVSEDMNIWNVLLFGLPLGKHSPYKEPLDYLVHKIHSSGLLHAWRLDIFNDLLNSNRITFHDASRFKTYEDLTEHDLLLVWIILLIGLICSVMMFFIEIVLHSCMKKYFEEERK